jgi:hypothetical protein
MNKTNRYHLKAYQSENFLNSKDARALRILSEYLEPESRLRHYKVTDTLVFMGSARVVSNEQARKALIAAEEGRGDIEEARVAVEMSAYY